jgi:hypothetical protein
LQAGSIAAEARAAPVAPARAAVCADDEDDGGAASTLLLYLPNRIFDLLDVVRARVRVGPGLGVTARATELADVKLGGWTSIYAGLHGPRGEAAIPWPVGFDAYAGAGVSFVEVESNDTHYGAGEFGLGLHLALSGVDLGVDPLELADFLTGLLTVDLMDDDY